MDTLAVHETVNLARIQFAANVSFHILFPSITIALGWILLFFKLRYNRTKDEKWLGAYFFWTKIFALCFALGVVSGITMSFQFGTNWPGFMQTVGNIAGPLLGYEVLTAFFLEASFLGIMLFGWRRVSNRVHTVATFLVAAGTTLSAFWILVLNSWMQTPVGFEMRPDASGQLQAHATNWLAILFNPSLPYRFSHMLVASGLTAAFLVAGISAWRWLKHDRQPAVMAALKSGVGIAAVLIPLQILLGDLHGLNTREHQPQKIAAMEALWETRTAAPFVLFAIPDEQERKNNLEIAIPGAASLVLGHSWNAEIKGLNDFVGNHPPVKPLFFGFRIMVAIGLAMLAISWWVAWWLWRKKGELLPIQAKALFYMTFSGWIATLSGWYVTEIGRQPWLVYGVLKTADAAAPIAPPMLGLTLAMYLAVYLLLIAAFIKTVFYMAAKANTPEGIAETSLYQHPGERRAILAKLGDTPAE